MTKFNVNFSLQFKVKLRKLADQNKQIIKKVDKSIDLLRKDPFYPSLKSHKIIRTNGDSVFSSNVSNDLRIIWQYSSETNACQVLDILDIGGHSGKNKVYK